MLQHKDHILELGNLILYPLSCTNIVMTYIADLCLKVYQIKICCSFPSGCMPSPSPIRPQLLLSARRLKQDFFASHSIHPSCLMMIPTQRAHNVRNHKDASKTSGSLSRWETAYNFGGPVLPASVSFHRNIFQFGAFNVKVKYGRQERQSYGVSWL